MYISACIPRKVYRPMVEKVVNGNAGRNILLKKGKEKKG